MIAALICLQAQVALTRQPLTIDVVSYQRVQHALANGAPDLATPDNYYVQVKSHYILAVDSDTVQPDADGNRHVQDPGGSYDSLEGYEESGRARGDLAAAFTEVRLPFNKADYKLHKVGSESSQSVDQVIHKGNRYLHYQRKTTVIKVETHTLGKRRAERREISENWGSNVTIVHDDGKVFDPSTERVYWCESKAEVRVDPAVYGFGSN